MREVLASRVDFRITDDNFARWSEAQSNLEKLPRSAIKPTPATGSDAVDRAVARLESSPLARRAIESAGLTVRDFVLETIALAQATEVAQTGRSLTRAPIPPENFQFVQRYSARVLRSHAQPRVARAESENYEMESDAADEMADQIEMQIQMRLEEREHEVEMRLAEAEMRREVAEREAEMRREYADALRQRRIMSRDTVPPPR